MKVEVSFNKGFSVYGISPATQCLYWQKMGIGMGTIDFIKQALKGKGGKLEEFQYQRKELPDITLTKIFVDYGEFSRDISWDIKLPIYAIDNNIYIAPQLCLDNEVQVHLYKYSSAGGGLFLSERWATLREGLTIDQATLLYESLCYFKDALTFKIKKEIEGNNK